MKPLDISERFLIYVTEQSFLVSLTSLIALSLNIKAVFLGFFLSYKVSFVEGFLHIFDTYSGLLNILILFSLSLFYYFFGSVTNLGISQSLFKVKIISKYLIPDGKLLTTLLLRDVIKAFFISNFINSLFVLRNRKFLQSLYDYKFQLITLKNGEDTKRTLFFQYLLASLISYYSIFFILLIIYVFITPVAPLVSGTTTTNASFNYWNFFNTVLRNNITLDISQYIIGGFSLFTGTFVILFYSNILETTFMASLNSGPHASSFVKYILPQFFPETMGYAFGIAISMVITDIMLSYIQSMARNQKSEYFFNRAKVLVINAGYYFILSIVLLVIGAIIEASLGVLNF